MKAGVNWKALALGSLLYICGALAEMCRSGDGEGRRVLLGFVAGTATLALIGLTSDGRGNK